MEENKGQILLYQTPDGESRIEVRLEGETVWLSLEQMAELFQRNKSTISRHIKNIFEERELDENSVVAKNATTAQYGVIEKKPQTHFESQKYIRPELANSSKAQGKEQVVAFFTTTTQHGAIQEKTQTYFESLRPEGANSSKALGNALCIARKGTTALKGHKHISQITNSCVFCNSSILNKNHVTISL